MAVVAFVAQALSVESRAGELHSLVDSPAGVTELSVSGQVDASDLFFISGQMPALRTLDLSGATVVAYSGSRLGNSTEWPADMIPSGVFAGTPMNSIMLPVGPIKLGDGVFTGSALTTMSVGANVQVIPVGTFAGCSLLISVTFAGPVSLEANAFSDCTALTAVNGSKNITSIGNRAFAGCTSLGEFAAGASLVSIGAEAFSCSGLREIDLTMTRNLKLVDDFAFASMPRLTKADLANCSNIGRGVLFGCPVLQTAVVNAASVPDYAYAGNKTMDAVTIAAGTESLGRYAMSGMSAVTDVVLPESIENLGDHAMEHMTGLHSITVAGNIVPALGENVWYGVDQPNVSLNILSGSTDDFKSAEQWCEFNIVSQSLSTDVVSDAVAPSLRARFAGDMLEVVAAGAEISELAVYDTDGVRLALLTPGTFKASVDCSGFDTRLYIVYARLAEGTEAVVKLAR